MTKVMLGRLRAESASDHLRSSFQALDLPRRLEGRLDRTYGPDEGRNGVRSAGTRGIRTLAVAMRVDEGRAVLERVDVAQAICKQAVMTSAPDSRQLWCKVRDCDWLQTHFAHRVAPICQFARNRQAVCVSAGWRLPSREGFGVHYGGS